RRRTFSGVVDESDLAAVVQALDRKRERAAQETSQLRHNSASSSEALKSDSAEMLESNRLTEHERVAQLVEQCPFNTRDTTNQQLSWSSPVAADRGQSSRYHQITCAPSQHIAARRLA